MSTKSTKQVQIDEAMLDSLQTTAARVRYLDSVQVPRADIARILGIRYQWVRNILITPVGKAK